MHRQLRPFVLIVLASYGRLHAWGSDDWQEHVLQNVSIPPDTPIQTAMISVAREIARVTSADIKFVCHSQRPFCPLKVFRPKNVGPVLFDQVKAGDLVRLLIQSSGLSQACMQIHKNGADIRLDARVIYITVQSEYPSGPLVIYDNFFRDIGVLEDRKSFDTMYSATDLVTRIQEVTGTTLQLDKRLISAFEALSITVDHDVSCPFDILLALMDILSSTTESRVELRAVYSFSKKPVIHPPQSVKIPLLVAMISSDETSRDPSNFFWGFTGGKTATHLASGKAFLDFGIDWIQYNQALHCHIVVSEGDWWHMARNPAVQTITDADRSSWVIQRKKGKVVVEEQP